VTRWIAAGGAFVVSLDSMVNIAFPSLVATFGAPPEHARWVIVSYVLMYALLSFGGGALGDRAGHERVFALGLAGTAAAYLVAGLAPTFGWLLAGRAVQGVAGGFVYGSAPALATRGAASRARALGFLNGAIGLAFAVGPLAAGPLVERLGWRAVFLARLPLALGALAWALAAGRARSRAAAAPARPAAGAGDAGRDEGRPRAAGLGPAAPVGHVLRPSVLAFVAFAGIFAIWLLGPFYLVERRGLAAGPGGALFMLTPLGMAVGGPAASRLIERIGARACVAGGLGLEAAGLAFLGAAGAATPLALVAAALFAAGLGLGVFAVPNMAQVMEAFPAGRQGAAGGLAFLARTLGVVVGVLVLAQVFGAARAALGFDAAWTRAMLVAAGAVAGAALLGLGRPGDGRPGPRPVG
jgi:MFS family permease